MKRIAATVMVLAIGLSLSACAGTGGKNGIARQQFDDDIDYGKVATVNEWAHRRGYQVHWINLPQKSRAERALD